MNPIVAMGTDDNGFSYKKYANGEGQWRKKITFTTPAWNGGSGGGGLYYCNVYVNEVPENVKEYGTIQFIVEGASGAVASAPIITAHSSKMYFSMFRVYGGNDSIKVTGELIVNGKWK